jgi:hypothetical protein
VHRRFAQPDDGTLGQHWVPARDPITFYVRLDIGCYAAVFSNYVNASGTRAGDQMWLRW